MSESTDPRRYNSLATGQTDPGGKSVSPDIAAGAFVRAPHGNALLTESDVIEIRGLVGRKCECGRSRLTYRQIGERFGVSAVTICHIVSRKQWAWVK